MYIKSNKKLKSLRVISFFKKIVLSFDLKELKLSHERIKRGRLFQSSGDETAKARDPYDLN